MIVYGYIDTMPNSIEEEAEELVYQHTRKELDKIAREENIKNPKEYPNKMAVAKEIVKAKKAKEYVKEPTGLYFER